MCSALTWARLVRGDMWTLLLGDLAGDKVDTHDVCGCVWLWLFVLVCVSVGVAVAVQIGARRGLHHIYKYRGIVENLPLMPTGRSVPSHAQPQGAMLRQWHCVAAMC